MEAESERRTWVWLTAVALLLGLASAGVLLLIGALWYAFGVFGAVILIGAVALVAAWASDRRNARAAG